jgi:hypothetical protein
MWKVASQVADHLVYVSGIGVDQRLSVLRMATGWGGMKKARKLAHLAHESIETIKKGRSLPPDSVEPSRRDDDNLLHLPTGAFDGATLDTERKEKPAPLVVGFGGSRGCAVLLKACAILNVPIHAVVLFDAVYSFGLFWWQWLDQQLYPFELPGNVVYALHVVAENESTPGFSPVLYPQRDGLLQVGIPGDHAEALRGPEAEEVALSWLSSIGVAKRFPVKVSPWGEPTRHLSLPRYSYPPPPAPPPSNP